MPHDVDVLIIGAGMSGLGLAVQLIRNYNTRNFELVEKSTEIGGTWWLNSYPGCGCDVPSHFFSYSFAPNPNWSHKFALQPEIHAYFQDVAKQYDIAKHVRFQSVVESAQWEATSGTWLVTIQDLSTAEVYQRRCKVLISAVGALSIPKKCDIKGSSAFKGAMFHTAEWDHSFDWKDKEVVMIGNGCSATQIMPVISGGQDAVKKVTQFSRQSHWLAERPNPKYSPLFQWTMKWVPFAMLLYRVSIFCEKELAFSGFPIESGATTRQQWEQEAGDYIRKHAPAEHRDFLVPKTQIACKRRVNDTDYLLSLHRPNVELVYGDTVKEIVEDGIRTASGKYIHADAIVLAHGFETHKFLFPMKIYGEDSIGLEDHWDNVSEGSPSAYFGTCVSGFPNFFIMMGPNTLSGHLSVIYTSECQINFTLRVIRPVLSALRATRSKFPSLKKLSDVVSVKAVAEQRDVDAVQEKAKGVVWASGCSSWFIDTKTGRNTIMYPDWQYKFWLRSIFIPWGDFEYRTSKDVEAIGSAKAGYMGGALAAAAISVGAWLLHSRK